MSTNRNDSVRERHARMSRKELVRISNRGKIGEVGLYRWIGVSVFIKPLLRSRLAPNHVTFFRILLTICAVIAIVLGSYPLKMVGLLFIHFSIVLDKVDGPFARFTGGTSALGKYLDVIMDHTTSAVLFYALLGVLIWGGGGSWWWLILTLGAILCAHLAAFLRAVAVERSTDLHGRLADWAFGDNLIAIMQVFTLAVIFSIEAAALVLLTFHLFVKVFAQLIILHTRSQMHVNIAHVCCGYVVVVWYVFLRVVHLQYQGTLSVLQSRYSNLKIFQQVHSHFTGVA